MKNDDVIRYVMVMFAVILISSLSFILFDVVTYDKGEQYFDCSRPCMTGDFSGTYNLDCVSLCQEAIWLNRTVS